MNNLFSRCKRTAFYTLLTIAGLLFVTSVASTTLAEAARPMTSLLPNGPGRPFTWTAYPVTEIGIADARNGTEITPTGSLETAHGELLLLTGKTLQPVVAPIRTLEDGYMPIVHYHFRDGAIRYDVTLFSWALSPKKLYRNPINFIRVRAFNFGAAPASSTLTLALRSGSGMHHFFHPHYGPTAIFGFKNGMALCNNKLLYASATDGQPQLLIKPGETYTHPQQLSIKPSSLLLLTQYDIRLKAGAQTQLVFRMPVHPISINDTPAIAQIRQMKCSDALSTCRAWWRRHIRGKGMQLYLSEPKVVDTFRASLMYVMLARDRLPPAKPGGRPIYVQNVNKLQYHYFWLRDCSNIVHAYDLTGHFNRARQCLRYILQVQHPDGNFISQPGQHDGWGQALWAIGDYCRLSGDMSFAKVAFPHVVRAVAWLEKARMLDPLHVLPGGNPHDDEFPNAYAHLTGDNFYALVGLHEAILLAQSLGHASTAAAWAKEYQDFHHVIFQRLQNIGQSDGDYMPPGLDKKGGHDWANLLSLYPHQLLSPNDPLVVGTLKHTVSEYAEGLLRYGAGLHDYVGMNNTESFIIRGEQRHALRDLYAVLVHTSATQAGWECAAPGWSNRDYYRDLAPHGWFGADYIAMVRNMLVRSQHHSLQLLSVLSPAWTKPGNILSLYNAPTRFGNVSLWAIFTNHGMVLHINAHFHTAPALMRLHLPWYATIKSVSADGKAMQVSGGTLLLPTQTREVRVRWQQTAGNNDWSYQAFVKRFEQAWNSRYFDHKAMSFGNGPDAWPK